MEANKIIKFLEGDWICKNTTVIPNKDIIKSEYKEKMVIKDHRTISITAFGIKDGKDITKDMIIELREDDEVTLKQGDFQAHGKIEGNMVTIHNEDYMGVKYIMRLYLMKDKYVYQQDVWKEENVIQSQMSYLERI